MYRTSTCGELRLADAGKTVTLAGWVQRVRKMGGMSFVDLRDRYGITQLVFNENEDKELCDSANRLGREFCIQVTGVVNERQSKNANLPTGDIEIIASQLNVLSESQTPPFTIEENTDGGDDIRMKYRYLDLRRPNVRKNLELRHKMTILIRNFLDSKDFIEVETPILIGSTPEGARDFVVPSRMNPGQFYALPQSPQTLKQLLMVSGFDRYFQIAKCFRDEDLRADRQPEFTQIDCEMSFVDQDDVINLFEDMARHLFKELRGVELPAKLRQMPWHEAMKLYGSDKPDLRFGNQITDLTHYFENTPFRVFQADYVGAVVYKGAADLPRRQFDAWQEWARQRGAKGLAYVQFSEDGELKGPVAKNLSDEERSGLMEAVRAEAGDAVFFAAGAREPSQLLLGAARVEIAKRQGLLKKDEFAFAWVVDFPLFKRTDDPDDDDVAVGHSAWTSMHHPFTMPSADWIDTFDKDPGHAMSDSYDIVCNGNEIGGGSVRIHRDDIQDRVLEVLGIGEEEARDKFGFLLEAFKFGAPPHAGIAFGWDRCAAILAGEDSIRDVIAFPKSGGGTDPLTGAPAPISDEQRAETGVDYDPEEDE
mgnify:CR=1 FL=1